MTVPNLLFGFTTAKATKMTVLYSKGSSRTVVLKVDFSETTVESAKDFDNTAVFIVSDHGNQNNGIYSIINKNQFEYDIMGFAGNGDTSIRT